MQHGRLSKFLSRVADIREGELKLTLLLSAFFFLVTAPHTVIKALRYSNLLDSVGSRGLPLAYILAALATGLVVVLNSRIRHRLSNQLLIIASLVFFIFTGLLFQVFLKTGGTTLSYLYWVWANILTVVMMTHYGLTLAEAFTSRQARRLIGFCGSGGILGGVAGGFTAFFLTRWDLGHLLLPLACALLFLCILVVRALFRLRKKQSDAHPTAASGRPDPESAGFKESYRAVRKNRYLLLISGVVILTGLIATFVDFQFSSKVEEVFTSAEQIQKFLGLFYGCLTTAAFFLQLFLTKAILAEFKIRTVLLFTPLVLLFGGLGVIVAGLTLPLAIFYKGSEESLSFSFNQSVRELLYIPLDRDLRYKARPFIDMFVNRFARVLAAVLLFAAGLIGKFLGIVKVDLPFASPVKDPKLAEYLTGVVIVFLILWILINLRINREYGAVIRGKIESQLSPEELIAKTADVDYTKLLVDTLDSRDRSSYLFSMYLYDLVQQNKLTDDVKDMIFQRVDKAKMASFSELFNAEGVSWIPGIGDDLGREELVTDIHEIMSSGDYETLIQQYAERVETGRADEVERMELAKLIGMMRPDSPLADRLEPLIQDPSPGVSRHAMESAAKLRLEHFVPDVVERLGIPAIRGDVLTALRMYGEAALPELERRFTERDLQPGLRAALLEALVGIGGLGAAEVLLGESRGRSGELEPDVIASLDRIRSQNPDVIFPRRTVMRLVSAAIQRYCQIYLELHRMEGEGEPTGMPPAASPELSSAEELRRKLHGGMDQHFEMMFHLMGLIYSRKEMTGAFQNLKTGAKDAHDNAIEHLDNTLRKDLRDKILSIVEDTGPEDRARKFQQILRHA